MTAPKFYLSIFNFENVGETTGNVCKIWKKQARKENLTSKCHICILELILTFLVLQNSWHFWTIVGSISFLLQNSCHSFRKWRHMVGSILFGIFLEFFGNFQSSKSVYNVKVSWIFTLLKSSDVLHSKGQLIKKVICIWRKFICLSRFLG